MKKYLIIGAGIAGINICSNLRKLCPDDQITLISNEKIKPYNRIWISDLLANLEVKDKTYFYLKNDAWYKDNNINVIIDAEIVDVDYTKKIAYDQNKHSYEYDVLFITAGSHGNKFPIDGWGTGNGVFSNIHYEDTIHIHNYINENKSYIKNIIIMGGGVLGLEAADSLKTMNPNFNITIMDVAPYYMSVAIDKEAGDFMEALTKKLNVKTIFNTCATKFNYDANNRLKSITTKDGKELDCQLCITSVGNASNIQNFIKNKQLKVNRGIIVNDLMETNIKDVYAAGDVIEIENIIIPKLVAVAIQTAGIAVKSAIGDKNYHFIPTNYHLIFDGLSMKLVALGNYRDIKDNDKCYIKKTSDSFIKYVFRNEKFIYGISINDPNSFKEILTNKCKIPVKNN